MSFFMLPFYFFFFNDTATTEIYTLSLHDALPICSVSNYFIGKDKAKWRSAVANYGRVKYEGVYPGIDLAYRGNPSQLEYDFTVAPGADPRAIELEFEGADKLSINRK